jgi:class 3 adenylate cyclase
VAPEGTERRLAAILSADVVGYSRLMADDEEATVRTLAAYREEIELLLRQHRGRLVDFTGDCFLAEFASVVRAVECAVEIQRVLAARNTHLAPDRKLRFRIGVHIGDVRVEGERVIGDGVNIAARLESLADPGGVCVSAEVHGQVHHRAELEFQDVGEQTVKNIPNPVHAYRVRVDPSAPRAAQATLASRRRVAVGFGLVLLLAVAVVAFWGTRRPERTTIARTGPPVVVLMDTAAPGGVYDEETLRKGGTNADVLNDVLRDLPVALHKETLTSTWEREDHVLNLRPDLILIHRSAFFHSMNLELGFGYPPFEDPESQQQWDRLYSVADNKLVAMLGHVGDGAPAARFLVYSRGTGGGWTEEDYRRRWVSAAEGRFPSLKGRVYTMPVPGGVESGSFRSAVGMRAIRDQVRSILELASASEAPAED